MEIKIHCKYDELINPKLIADYSKNRNQHGQDQIERLGLLYETYGVRHPIIMCSQRKVIAAGHGRKLAAILKGMKLFPVVYQEFKSDEEFHAFTIADNAIADWAKLDFEGINVDLEFLGPDFNLDALAIQGFTLDMAEKEPKEEKESTTQVCPHCGLEI